MCTNDSPLTIVHASSPQSSLRKERVVEGTIASKKKLIIFTQLIDDGSHLSPEAVRVPLLEPNPSKHEQIPTSSSHRPCAEHSSSNLVPAF